MHRNLNLYFYCSVMMIFFFKKPWCIADAQMKEKIDKVRLYKTWVISFILLMIFYFTFGIVFINHKNLRTIKHVVCAFSNQSSSFFALVQNLSTIWEILFLMLELMTKCVFIIFYRIKYMNINESCWKLKFIKLLSASLFFICFSPRV